MSVIQDTQKEEVKDIVCDVLELEPDEITETSRFVEDHGADSLRAIEILASLERAFGVTIDQQALRRMTNLENVYAVLAEVGTAPAEAAGESGPAQESPRL